MCLHRQTIENAKLFIEKKFRHFGKYFIYVCCNHMSSKDDDDDVYIFLRYKLADVPWLIVTSICVV